MKYNSSFTKPIKLTILILFLFWAINTLVIINTNGIRDAVISSIFMLAFAIFFVSAFVKGIYVVVENDTVKYVHMWILRKRIEIGRISKIQKSLMGGMYSSLSLIYEDNGKPADIKIGTITFKKENLKQFILDLRRQNPKIDLDQSVNELIS